MSLDSKQTRKQASHDRILDVAARAVGRNGCAGLGIADVMQQAGLTHGGFYAHFESRQALLAETIEHAGKAAIHAMYDGTATRRALGASPLRALVEIYLSEKHMMSTTNGCPLAALASEVTRQGGDSGEVSRRQVETLIDIVKQALPQASPAGGEMVIASTLIGALQMARILGNQTGGKELLATTRQMLIQQYDVGHE